jgi:prevent-host-death family protein
MEQPRHHESISARALSRNVAAVLDRVEMERQTLVVTRNGRPMATLMPLTSRQNDGRTPVVVVLSPLQEQILLKAASRAPQVTASFEDLGDWRDTTKGLSGLERDGLLERCFAGHAITQQGALVAAALQARGGA